jgi:F-type H+-transporting ATPase subunit a
VRPDQNGLDFPEINTILRWQDLFPSFNKIAIITVLAMIIGIAIFWFGSRKNPMLAPTGSRNISEIGVEFIEQQVVMPTMGASGMKWTPWLLSLFVFIYLCNLPGILPVLQMPATARMAIPLALSLIVWVTFIGTGIKHNGFFGYFKSVLFPPGVPKALYLLVTPIEFISTIIVRPFSLTVRLFANMLAGHILLVTFALLSEAMFQAETMQPVLNIMGILPMAMLIFLTLFEILVGFLQAYIFTILASVYIGGAAHPDH